MARRTEDLPGDRVSQAAANNAHWCRTVCAAHGLASTFCHDYWLLAPGPSLPLYPNLVTLSADGTDAQLACIEEHHRSGSGAWSVKDGFNRLDLRPKGFDVLLEAEWFFGPPATPAPAAAGQRVRTEAELRDWEAAWAQRPGDWSFGDSVFPPALLHDERIAFLFTQGGAGMTAGLVANCDAGAIGISNAFVRSGQPSDLAGCLHQATALWPGLPVVGYGTEAQLEVMEQLDLGLERTGPCRVWQRPAGA
jgi:hypothetical protein